MTSTSLYNRPPGLDTPTFLKCARWASNFNRAISKGEDLPMEEPPAHYELYRMHNPAAIEPLRAQTLQQDQLSIQHLRQLNTLQGGSADTTSSSIPMRGFEMILKTLETVQTSADRVMRANMETTLQAIRLAAPGPRNRPRPAPREVQRDNRRERHFQDRHSGGRDAARPRADRPRQNRHERDRHVRFDRPERRSHSPPHRRRADTPYRAPAAPARPDPRPITPPASPPPLPFLPPAQRPLPLIYDYEDMFDIDMREASPIDYQLPAAPQPAHHTPVMSPQPIHAAAALIDRIDQLIGPPVEPVEPVEHHLAAGQVDEVFVYQPLAVLDAIPPTVRLTPAHFSDSEEPSLVDAVERMTPVSEPGTLVQSERAQSVTNNLENLTIAAVTQAVDEYLAVEPSLPLDF